VRQPISEWAPRSE